MTARNVEVYALCDPITRQPKYVGWAVDANKRMITHMRHCGNDAMLEWMRELSAMGNKPILVILETVEWEDRYRKEKEYMEKFLNEGCSLTNQVGNSHYWEKRRQEKLKHHPSGVTFTSNFIQSSANDSHKMTTERAVSNRVSFSLEQEYYDLFREIARQLHSNMTIELRRMIDERALEIGLEPISPIMKRRTETAQ